MNSIKKTQYTLPTKADVGLTNVDDTSDANKPVSSATQTALNLKAPLASPAFTGTPTGITATHVGLGNVNNTADTAKPVSTAQQTALDAKQATLVSGTNIKTVNGTTLLGSGDLVVSGGGTTKHAENIKANDVYGTTALLVVNNINTRPVGNGGNVFVTAYLPPTYAGGGITVDVWCAVDTDADTTRTIVWATSIMRVQTGTDNLNTDSYATAANTASVTSGAVRRWQKSTVSFASGSAMDSAVAGETIRVRLVLSFPGGGNVLISNVVVRET